MNFKRLFIAATVLVVSALSACGSKDHTDVSEIGNGNTLTNVTVNASVRTTGQYPESFVLTFANTIEEEHVSPEDFHLVGKAGYWGSDDTRRFEAHGKFLWRNVHN